MAELHFAIKQLLAFTLCLLIITASQAQIVINEIVEDEQSAGSSDVSPDTREFVELFNAGANPVDLTGWTLSTFDLATGTTSVSDTIPSGTIAPGGYFVIGAAGVPNVNFTPFTGELWQNGATIFELRRPGGVLEDAVGLETFRGVELANATQEQLDQIASGETVGPNARGGWWGQIESNNAIAPNVPLSIARYRDGRDNNINGIDFGMLPITPGASNNLPQNTSHTIPDVDSMSVGTPLGSEYYASFVLPRVVNPTVASGINPTAISPSPQGGNVIIAWDETGGGNAAYSRELVNQFSLAAYIDPAPLNTTGTAIQSEATVYGIGSTDIFFSTPDAAGLLGFGSAANGSTGLGWLIQRVENKTVGTVNTTVLQLIDFNDGGDGVPADADWIVLETIDLSGQSAAWHNLSIDYDPVTGDVVATHNDDTFNFTTRSDLVGNFYVGYRENLPGTGAFIARPPTYDLFLDTPDILAGDYNGDNIVDAADYAVWRDNLDTSVTLPGDTTPGTVTQADYDVWRGNFGATAGSLTAGGTASGAVPEPTAIVLCALGVLVVAGRKLTSCL